MAATLLDGNALLETVKDDLRARVERLAQQGITPGLGTILVGDDPPSHAYVRLKREDSAQIGVRSVHTELPATVSQQELHAVIDRYRIASNGEIVLVLFDIPSGTYMNAYLPNPNCLGSRSRDRSGMMAARRAFMDHCPHPTAEWQLLGASVDVSGVGYWNSVRTTLHALQNGAELRPLTNLSVVVGCGVGTS